MKALIVDDELQGRENLEYFLKEFHPEVQVVGLCSNIDEADQFIHSNKPDLLFLDISMPGGTGFELFEKVNLKTVKVIFVTAHEEFAAKAFEVDAFDYLTKPLSRTRLDQVIQKVKEHHNSSINVDRKINLRVSNSNHLLNEGDIVFLEADGNYTTVALKGGEKLVVSKGLKSIQSLYFNELPFVRVHQSFIVNVNHVSEYDSCSLRLSNGQKVSISRSNYDAFLNAISNF